MVLNVILGALAVLSLVLLLWQWVAARRFPLHQRSAGHRPGPGDSPEADLPGQCPALQPGITLLKPLKGADEYTEMCLRSWLAQAYAGPVQVLFGVAAADDPACAVVRKLLAEFPAADAQLVVCPEQPGSNAKVAKLIQLERLAKHELICVSDADVHAPADFLAEAVETLTRPTATLSLEAASVVGQASRLSGEPSNSHSPPDRRDACPTTGFMVRRQVALVNCFYRLANPTTLAMQWEAVAINADFWSQVLQSCSLKPMDFALGAAMLTRRAELAGIGGFAAIKDCLADDYQLGNRIARNRSGTGVPPVCGSQGEKRAAFTSHAQQDRRDACPTKRIEICPVVVECWDAPAGWAAVWKHQLRWARTIRVCQPGPYFFSILSNPTLWPLLWVALEPGRPSLFFLGIALATRLVVTLDLQRRLASGGSIVNRKSKIVNQMEPPHVGCYGGGFWLAPVKDVLQTAIWALAFTGNTVEWRGRRMKLRRDGTLIPA